MHSRTLLIVSLFFAVVGIVACSPLKSSNSNAITTRAEQIPAQDTQCHRYVIIQARGTHEAQGPSPGFAGMVNETLAKVRGGVNYDVVYPADLSVFKDTGNIGVQDAVNKIRNGTERCPDQRYVLLGLSQGATVINRVMEQLEKEAASESINRISAILLEGNPYHLPGKRGNIDNEGGTTTSNRFGILFLTVLFGVKFPAPDAFYDSGRLLDICYKNDVVCTGLSLGGLLTFGQAHLKYQSDPVVQSIGADFIIEKLTA